MQVLSDRPKTEPSIPGLRCLPRVQGLALACLALSPTIAFGQVATACEDVPYPVDTGLVSNTAATRDTVAAFHVGVEGVPWMRLVFSDVRLSGDVDAGTGSILRITSLEDGHSQVLGATSLQEWGNSTACFNGDLLLVEVIAHPGTGENRVVLEKATVGVSAVIFAVCEPDSRVLSTDLGVARILQLDPNGQLLGTSGGTAFLVDDGGLQLPRLGRARLPDGHDHRVHHAVQRAPLGFAKQSRHARPRGAVPLRPCLRAIERERRSGGTTGLTSACFGTATLA